MDILILFLLIIGAAFIAPIITRKFGLPEVTGIILFGIIFGGYGIFTLPGMPDWSVIRIGADGEALTEEGRILLALADLGLIFLMFLAGLEMNIEMVKKDMNETVFLASLTFAIPFAAGFFLASFFGFPIEIAFLTAIILATTSMDVIIPVLKELGITSSRIGSLIIGAITINDVLSMVCLAVILKMSLGGIDGGDIVQFILIILLFFMSVLYLTPKFAGIFLKRPKMLVSVEAETRFLIVSLLTISILSEIIGIHPIIGAFIVGLAFSETVKTGWFMEKLNAIGYGFFIPIFFFVIGAKTNLSIFLEIGGTGNINEGPLFCIALIAIAFASKFIGSAIPCIMIKLKRNETLGISFAMTTKLGVCLAAASIAFENDLITLPVFSSFVLLAIITTIMSPIMTKKFLHKEEEAEAVMFKKADKD